jgi:cation transport ATPase
MVFLCRIVQVIAGRTRLRVRALSRHTSLGRHTCPASARRQSHCCVGAGAQDINALGLSRDDTALLPEEHATVVRHLHTAGYTLAVVSDGHDDSLVWSEADVRIALQDGLARAQVPHVILSEATLGPLPLAIRMAQDSTRLVQQHWHVITVANTLAFGLASLGGIGPLGALGLSKGSALAVVGRALYAVQP